MVGASGPEPAVESSSTDLELFHSNLPKGVTILRGHPTDNPLNTCSFYILGTAHVSRQSCEDVRKLIQTVRPQVVMIELCSARKGVLAMQEHKVPTVKEMLHSWRHHNNNIFQVLYAWVLASVGEHLEVLPGEEFRVAVEEAGQVGAMVMLGDRPVEVTVARVWAALSRWQKLRLLWGLLATGLWRPEAEEMRGLLEEMRDSDAVTEAIREVGKQFPPLLGPLITERDQYMVTVMRSLASKASRVVTVVGGGHLPGIREHWDADIDLQELMAMPARKPRSVLSRPLVLLTGGGVIVSVLLLWRNWTRSW